MIGDEPSSDLAALVVPQTGRLVATGDRYEPCRLVDAGGVAVAAVTAYFRDLLAAGRAESTVRSYGMEDQPGDSWQDRWLASGADSAGREWREVPAAWLHARGQYSGARLARLSAARLTVICADTVRPSTGWFTGAVMRGGHLSLGMQATRDTEGFARLRELCDRDPRVSAGARAHVLHRAAVIIGAKGSLLRQITVGDVMELLDAEASAHANPMAHGSGFYRMLHRMGIFEAAAPQMLRELTASRQRTPGELIDRYDLAGRPVRDLLVDYLKERQPALDYSSLRKLSAALAGGFWKNLERHHPGISSLHLPAQVSEASSRLPPDAAASAAARRASSPRASAASAGTGMRDLTGNGASRHGKRYRQSLVLAGTPLPRAQRHAPRPQRDGTGTTPPHWPLPSVPESQGTRPWRLDPPLPRKVT